MIYPIDREVATVLREPVPRAELGRRLSLALTRPHIIHSHPVPDPSATRVRWVVAGTVAGAVGASAAIYGIKWLHHRSAA